MMTRATQFEQLRPLLFSVAYRMLGSVSDAEDVVQEAWLRFTDSSAAPQSDKAFLTAVVTRLAIDHLRSARVRRESYIGPWFPEPLLNDPYEDPERSVELADSLSMAALILLERLTPLERAVFVLREVFDFSFAEIATTLSRSEESCRQTAVRARRHIKDGWPRFEPDVGERDRLAQTFMSAFQAGDVDSLHGLLAADAQLIGDSGGNAPQVAAQFVGARRVARALGAAALQSQRIGSTFDLQRINGQPGVIFRDPGGNIVSTWCLEIRDGRVQTIRSVLNPDKLSHLGQVTDPWNLIKQANADPTQLPLDDQ